MRHYAWDRTTNETHLMPKEVLFYFPDDRHVALWKSPDEKVIVSTIFLVFDHSFFSERPVLWETMVFGGALDMEQQRYSTHAEAVEGHNNMVQRVITGEVK